MKNYVCAFFAAIGGFLSMLTERNPHLTTLIICMIVDYVTGFLVAAVFNKSNKTKDGALDSRAGFKGLCRKGMILLIVLIAYRLDLVIGSNVIMTACIFGFIANETISIIENAGLMGIPIPGVIRRAIEILKDRSEGGLNE